MGLHVAVEPSEIKRADATVLFAKLGGATGPYIPLVHNMSLARRPRRSRTRYSVVEKGNGESCIGAVRRLEKPLVVDFDTDPRGDFTETISMPPAVPE